MALAQCTTVTSCLSPSSFRLVSRETGLSGSAGSWPALTTVGSMACSRLSRDRQERRLGDGARLWEQGAAGRRHWAGPSQRARGQRHAHTHTHVKKQMYINVCTNRPMVFLIERPYVEDVTAKLTKVSHEE